MQNSIMNEFFRVKFSSICFISLAALSCSGGSNHSDENPSGSQKEPIGVDQTRVVNTTSNAFSSHVKNLTDLERIRTFNIGDDFFENPWIEKTSSTELRDGLGPLFNNNACQDCHIRDGRGHAPGDLGTDTQFDFSSILFKAIKTEIDDQSQANMLAGVLANVGDTHVGPQLQHEAIFNIKKEVSLNVTYQYHNISFEDGYTVELRKPIWHLTSNYADLGYDFDHDTVFSARVAQPMIGLGLLALIDESVIQSLQDVEDSDGNGISGKANRVWDAIQQKTALGRFGWKAGQPSVRQQAAGAFNNDMGLTSEIFREESCLSHQADCLNSPNGNGDSLQDYPYEVSTTVLDAIEFYASHLAVPKRRNNDAADVKAGRQLFINAQCIACHKESYTTIDDANFPELSNQFISPYTDLLLHDMGEALADFTLTGGAGGADVLIEYQATTREWRTPPLWGIGLTKTVDPEASFLHDGRARTILEAVLWHGGEAETSKQTVLAFDATQRRQLLAFLNDL